jgi:hypothetical protein
MSTEHLSHDIPDTVPAWYKQQPYSPHLVYDSSTVRDIQRTLSVPETGLMDENTVNHIKGLQYALGIPATGTITLETAQAIQRLRDRFTTG